MIRSSSYFHFIFGISLCSFSICSVLMAETPTEDSRKRFDGLNKTTARSVFEKEYDCGTAEEELLTHCVKPDSFPNCASYAPSVKAKDIKIKHKFAPINGSVYPQMLTVEVKWNIPKAGNSDIWGWQVTVTDLHLGAGAQFCVQVNKLYRRRSNDGDRYVFYTFPSRFGTRIMVSVQGLPAMNDAPVKKVVNIQGFCDFFPESPCCHKVKNISFKQSDQTSVMVTWPSLGNTSNSKILTAYDVFYKSYPNYSCHSGAFRSNFKDSFHTSHVIIKDLRPTCQNYTLKVRPIFKSSWCDACLICEKFSKGGRFSKFFKFQLDAYPQVTQVKRNLHLLSNLLKALLVVVSVCLFTGSVIAIIRHRKIGRQNNEKTENIRKMKPATELFIAHSSHCGGCEDVALSLAAYINMTGHCECFLDLCSLPNEWSPGKTQYYENEINKRQKVIIMCTVNEEQENHENPRARNFIYQKNLVRSEILVNCTTTKFIPVYMDFSSDLDVPCFLRNKKSFSLPSQLMELLLYIIEQPLCKPVPVCPMLSLQEDSELLKQKKSLEVKIKELKIKHQKSFKNKNNNLLTKIV